MNKALQTCAALGFGAGLMYYLDPNLGKRRRARLRDSASGALHDGEEFLEAAVRDLNNRAHGLVAESKSAISHERVSDEVLTERVKAALGRIVTRCHCIDVSCENGKATLSGPILFKESDQVIRAISGVRGVKQVINQLETHEVNGVPNGQVGSMLRTGQRTEFLQRNWAPGARLMACLAGCGIAAYGAKKGGKTAKLLETVGLGLFARGITNIEMDRLLGRNGSSNVTIEKTMNIQASPDEVFRFWSDIQNFPRFMSHVKEVRDLGDGRSHWVVDGPGGTRMHWDAQITDLTPYERICWSTMGSNGLAHNGSIDFQSNERGGTQVRINLCYKPPAGFLGHTVAHLLGADPKAEMDADLARFKTMIETGKPPRDASLRGNIATQHIRM